MLATALVAARLILLFLPLVLAVDKALPARTGRVVIPDASRYQQILNHAGRPYRDFPVEYPPVLLGAARLLHGSTVVGTLVRLGFVSLALDLGIAALLWWGWGSDAAIAYLLVGLPLAFFVYFRLDLLSVALALLGTWLVKRRREGSGALSLALAFFTKFWPATLVPVLAARRRWRTVLAAVASIAAGLALWVAWAGFDGPGQVLTLRGATGWQVESLVGSIQWAVLGARPQFQLGALRVGTISAAAEAIAVSLFVAVLIVVCRSVSRGVGGQRAAGRSVVTSHEGQAVEGIASLAVVTALLLAAPVLSPQYLSWLLPWAGIATGLRDRSLLAALGFATVVTGAMWWLPLGTDAWFKAFLLARNASLVAVLVMCLVRLRRPAAVPANRAGQTRGTYTK